MIEVKRALVSVSDKTGLVEFATRLSAAGVELVSSGGTADALERAGLAVTRVTEVTGSPEILGGRVKTLHPSIHGAILADLSKPAHQGDLTAQRIERFQLVVSNLYPFRQTVQKLDSTEEEIIEQIDIGGPAMVRAAAKNHRWVGIVTSPDQYGAVAVAIENGGLDTGLRRTLAREAFFHTAAYDASIVTWLEGLDADFPDRIAIALERDPTPLKYGENPHQRAGRFHEPDRVTWWDQAEKLNGPAASYLNVFDADAAWSLVHDLAAVSEKPSVVIVKHANPCGASSGDSLAEAYQRAYDCDPRSAFGGIVAFSQPVDAQTVERVVAAAQADVIVAPAYDVGVLEAIVGRRKNTRVFQGPPPEAPPLHLRPTSAGWLVQTQYGFDAEVKGWRVVTDRSPSDEEMRDAVFAWRVCGSTTSNSIVIAEGETAWGIGAGQQNRVEASEIARNKADGRGRGGALASDAFFPFSDGIEVAAEAGVGVVVQPGGSIRDDEVIARANELGLAMVMTGERHFRH